MAAQRGFLDLDDRCAALSNAADPLERLSSVIDFAIVRPELETSPNRSCGPKRGRPSMDPVLMFKVFVIPAPYGLPDAQAAFRIPEPWPVPGSRRWRQRPR